MPMSLGEILDHPSLSHAEPVLLTGGDHTARVVRWVHSSEVLDIAPLLRGGELLLTGGLVLSDATPERQRTYIRDLAAHGVTAVAVETATDSTSLSDALIDEARRQGFALIQLSRTVPFVEVTESINGLLINDSVQRLRIADSLSDELSAQLTSGGDLQHLADTLAASTGAGIAVRDRDGETLATASATTQGPEEQHETLEAPITVHGVITAVLELESPSGVDPAVLEAALNRAPQAFGLALLRTQPPTPSGRATRALFHALRDPGQNSDGLVPLLEASGLTNTEAFVAVAVANADTAHWAALEQAMRRNGRQVIGHAEGDEVLAVVALLSLQPERSRQALIDDMRQVVNLGSERQVLGVGPLVRSSERLPHTTAEARRCLDPGLRQFAGHGVIDANTCSLDRLVHQLNADDVLHEFVHEQLGGILQQPPETHHRLLDTLEVFFDCAANKTETARRLHLRRQTLYQRLNKLSWYLGREVTDPASLADLQVAVRLRHVLGRRCVTSPHSPETSPGSVDPTV